MIQDYEVMLVLNPALNEDDNASARERVNELLTRSDGEIVSEEDWGTRRLAYPIKKAGQTYLEGSYYLIKFNQDASFIQELEGQLRLTEPVLRSMVVRATPVVESRPRQSPPDPRHAASSSSAGYRADAGPAGGVSDQSSAAAEATEEPAVAEATEEPAAAEATEEPAAAEATEEPAAAEATEEPAAAEATEEPAAAEATEEQRS
ncbi:30S ribosomal protein S6 [SAR202 cluster bacterium AD-804-J14_MRT_500m]|nr:30S ribosomal protein S6 [SAR202 cluster bacterium AD-804-J14_MRT_500m]